MSIERRLAIVPLPVGLVRSGRCGPRAPSLRARNPAPEIAKPQVEYAHAVTVSYIMGDATAPVGDGPRIIAHVCNDIGGWGAGFVLAISRRWPGPEADFRRWHRDGTGYELGAIRVVLVGPSLFVANMIGQRGIRSAGGTPPVRYEALEKCLATLGDRALEMKASIHMPRIGCGLAGGKWDIVERIIERTLCARSVEVCVYDLPK